MTKFNLIIFSALFFLFNHRTYAQQTLNDCGNLGVETGTFDGWEGQYGTWAADYVNNSIFYLSQNIGFKPESHRIHKVSDGFLPEITSVQIPYVAPGSNYSIQLGNSIKGGEYEQLRTSFKVDSSNSLFQYRFAVVFEDPDHTPIEQPSFELLVSDQTGTTVPCGFYRVTAGNNIDGFQSEGNIRFRNWTTAAVDLRDYIGQVVTLTISTYDCSKGGHWGMALFDAACFEAKIQAFNHCPGVDSSITLAAPEGFQKYLWSNGETDRVIHLQSTGVGQDVSVEFSPYSSLSDSCRLSLSYKIPGQSDLIKSPNASFCENNSLQIKANIEGDQFQYLWMPGNITTPTISISSPGNYTLQVTKGDCILRDTVAVTMILGPMVAMDAHNPACDGKNDGYLKSILTSNEAVNYLWSNQATTAEIQNLPSGLYKLSVTGVETGCVSKSEKLLVQSMQVFAHAKILQMPFCSNWPEGGKATVEASSGVPPYQYVWSTGATSPQTPIYREGQFKVTVTDSEGCQAVDLVTVKPIRAGLETEGNICWGGQDGVIEINAVDGEQPYQYALGNNVFVSDPKFENLKSGAYTVQVKDHTGCIREFETKIDNILAEAFRIDLPKDSSILLGSSLTIRASPNYPVASVDWTAEDIINQADSLSIEVFPKNSTKILVKAVDEHGCHAFSEMMLVVQKDYHLFIPNVFEPNGGEGNNRFYFSAAGTQIKDVRKCQIYDRWGSMVFEDFDFEPNNPSGGWDGKKGGADLSPGVYAYRLEIEFVDGEQRVFLGDVTLLR